MQASLIKHHDARGKTNEEEVLQETF